MSEYFSFALISAIVLLLINISFSIKEGKQGLNLFESICDGMCLWLSIWAWYWVGVAGGLTGKMAILCLEIPALFIILAARVVALFVSLGKRDNETCKNENN